MTPNDEINRLNGQVAELKQWVADLQSGMYVNCVYCGKRYGRSADMPASMADVLTQHVRVCPKHPMSALIRCSVGAGYLIRSLLAYRGGATNHLLLENLAAIHQALKDAGAEEYRSMVQDIPQGRSEQGK